MRTGELKKNKIISYLIISTFLILLPMDESDGSLGAFQEEVVDALNQADEQTQDLLDSVVDAANAVSESDSGNVTVDDVQDEEAGDSYINWEVPKDLAPPGAIELQHGADFEDYEVHELKDKGYIKDRPERGLERDRTEKGFDKDRPDRDFERERPRREFERERPVGEFEREKPVRELEREKPVR